MPDIDPTPLEKSFVIVEGKRIAYHERGTGESVLFLHGNPTSSYLWRNVIPHVEPCARCLAPDLIGMGDSDKLDDPGPGTYRFAEHRRYLDAFIDSVYAGDRITLVVHDWGSGLGFDWARRNADRVAGIAYMEAIFPMRWEQFPEAARDMFRAFRTAEGENLILGGNAFVEGVLPGAVLRDLGQEEMEEYRRPCAGHRRAAGAGAVVPEPDRGVRGRQPLRPGGQPPRDRPGDRRLAPHPLTCGAAPPTRRRRSPVCLCSRATGYGSARVPVLLQPARMPRVDRPLPRPHRAPDPDPAGALVRHRPTVPEPPAVAAHERA